MPLRSNPIESSTPAARPRLAVVPGPGDGLGADAMALPSEIALLLRVPLPLPRIASVRRRSPLRSRT